MIDKKYIQMHAIICIIFALPLSIQSAANESIELLAKLHEAVLSEESQEITRLIQSGADPHGRLNDKTSPLEAACIHGKLQSLETLMPYYDERRHIDAQGYIPLHFAAASGKYTVIKFLCSKRPLDIDKGLPSGHTALHLATNALHEESVEILLDHKADPNAKCIDGNTPLHYACHHGNINLIRLLVEAGGLLDARNSSDVTPRAIACESGDLPTQYYLQELEKKTITQPTCSSVVFR